MLKKSITSLAMIGAVALALASSGGGDKKKSTITSGAKSVKTTPGFSLQAGRSYSNALVVKTNTASPNTIITYRKGNTIYIVPPAGKNTYRPVACSKNNLNLLNLKVNLSNK